MSYVKGTEWGRLGAKRRKRLGAGRTFSRVNDVERVLEVGSDGKTMNSS